MNASRTTTLFLVLDAVVFAVFAVAFLVAPLRAAELVGVRAADAAGAVDLRALYGGFQLGVAVFLLWCARTPALHRAGLLLAAITLTGAALARSVGIVLDGGGTPIMLGILVLEAGGASLNGALLHGRTRSADARPVASVA
jgi:hypothetical protein